MTAHINADKSEVINQKNKDKTNQNEKQSTNHAIIYHNNRRRKMKDAIEKKYYKQPALYTL